jgi:hypothetical protein
MESASQIDYFKLIDAISFYTRNGYQYIDLKWAVPEEYSDITRPVNSSNFPFDDKVLVASGEQSFIELLSTGELIPGQYVGITPCFRDERVDEFHKRYFMKVELIDTQNVNPQSLQIHISNALAFYSQYIDCETVEQSDGTFDINVRNTNIELGSYGIREHNGLSWIFATGCAEPRLSTAINIAVSSNIKTYNRNIKLRV